MMAKARVLIIVGDEGEVLFETDGDVDVDYWEQGQGKEPPAAFRDLADNWAEERGLPV
jgi:hypothetical protein